MARRSVKLANPFRHDRRTYSRGQTAQIVEAHFVKAKMATIHHRTLVELLGSRWEERAAIIASWPNHRIHGFLQLIAEELGRITQPNKDRLELLWQEGVAVLQSRV